jgi:putative transposase
LYRKDIKLSIIRPGKAIENAFARSFNGCLRDESLNTKWFLSIKHAREIIENWRKDYDTARPYSSLGGLPSHESMELDGRAKIEVRS